jgi:hypothetical protein
MGKTLWTIIATEHMRKEGMKIIAATSRIGIHLLLDRATYTSRKHDM